MYHFFNEQIFEALDLDGQGQSTFFLNLLERYVFCDKGTFLGFLDRIVNRQDYSISVFLKSRADQASSARASSATPSKPASRSSARPSASPSSSGRTSSASPKSAASSC